MNSISFDAMCVPSSVGIACQVGLSNLDAERDRGWCPYLLTPTVVTTYIEEKQEEKRERERENLC